MLVAEMYLGRHFGTLRHDKPPKEFAGGFVKALHQSTTCAFEAIATGKKVIVGAKKHSTAGNGWIPVGCGSGPHDPLDVFRRGQNDTAIGS